MFGNNTGAHRALPDVLALEAVLRHPSLCGDLESLPFRSPQLQTKLWVQQKRLYTRASHLIKAVGKPSLTSTQAKKLDALEFMFQSISLLRQQCSSQDKLKVAWWLKPVALGSIPSDDQDFSFFSFAFFQTPLGEKVSI